MLAELNVYKFIMFDMYIIKKIHKAANKNNEKYGQSYVAKQN